MRNPRALALPLGYVVAYVLLDWVSFIHPIAPYAITPWNPPPGASLALLLAKGPSQAPWVFLAVAIGELTVHGGVSRPGYALLFSIVLAGGYTAVAVVLRSVARIDPRLPTRRDLAAFIAVVAAGAMVIAAAYVAAHVVAGDEPWQALPEHAVRFWIGDMIGIVVTTPFLLAIALQGEGAKARRSALEMFLQAGAILLAVGLVIGQGDALASRYFYLLFLPVVWIAVRHGFEGATIALLVTQLALIVAVQLAGYSAASVFDVQLFLLALAVTGLFLGLAVSESGRARATLQAREAELDTIVTTAPDAIIAADSDGRIVAMNPAGESMFGAASSRLEGTPLAALIPTLAGRGDVHGERTRALRTDGSGFDAEVSLAATASGGRVARIGVLRDVSARLAMQHRLREREAELDRTMRLAAAAELSSALAHELNQPLTAAVNYIEACDLLLQRQDTPRERLAAALGLAVGEVERAGEVVRRLRDIYRGSATQRSPLDPATLIDSALRITRRRLERGGIAVALDVAPDLPAPMVDRVQMEMVLHNLINNAADALAATLAGERRIAIAARRVDNGFVEIAVRDNGPGVSEQIAPRLFTTFASTKTSGMGLGLAISRSIVEAHGGRLWLDVQAPGACFKLTLPARPNEDTALR